MSIIVLGIHFFHKCWEKDLDAGWVFLLATAGAMVSSTLDLWSLTPPTFFAPVILEAFSIFINYERAFYQSYSRSFSTAEAAIFSLFVTLLFTHTTLIAFAYPMKAWPSFVSSPLFRPSDYTHRVLCVGLSSVILTLSLFNILFKVSVPSSPSRHESDKRRKEEEEEEGDEDEEEVLLMGSIDRQEDMSRSRMRVHLGKEEEEEEEQTSFPSSSSSAPPSSSLSRQDIIKATLLIVSFILTFFTIAYVIPNETPFHWLAELMEIPVDSLSFNIASLQLVLANGKVLTLLLWSLALLIFVPFVIPFLSGFLPQIVARKLFHFLAVALFAPVTFLYVCVPFSFFSFLSFMYSLSFSLYSHTSWKSPTVSPSACSSP